VSQPDVGQLLAQARQMQERMQTLQRELAARRVEGSAGGGMVVAVATGDLRILEIRIEPSLVQGGDHAMLQDLCAAAVNAALASAQRLVQEEMGRLSGGLGIPNPFPGAPTGGSG
jgi:DNA-binding YbaB/EbfC family protein